MPGRAIGLAAGIVFLACLAACATTAPTAVAPVIAVGNGSQTITATRGAEVDISLWSGAAGLYDSLPVISSSAVKFLDESLVGPPIPSGPSQQFRFSCVAAGTAIVDFGISYPQLKVEDTIVVR